MWPWWVKIPTENFTDVTLAIGDIFGDDVRGGDGGLGVVYMEIHKVADEVVEMVVNMEVDKVDNMLVKIPEEEVKIVKDVKIA